jgi:hypothetical protein
VAFSHQGEIWIHRVMAITNDELLTHGDANPRFDGRVPRKEFLGRLDGLYDPKTGRPHPFRGRRAFYNAFFCSLAGPHFWQARLSWVVATLLRKVYRGISRNLRFIKK